MGREGYSKVTEITSLPPNCIIFSVGVVMQSRGVYGVLVSWDWESRQKNLLWSARTRFLGRKKLILTFTSHFLETSIRQKTHQFAAEYRQLAEPDDRAAAGGRAHDPPPPVLHLPPRPPEQGRKMVHLRHVLRAIRRLRRGRRTEQTFKLKPFRLNSTTKIPGAV